MAVGGGGGVTMSVLTEAYQIINRTVGTITKLVIG